MTAAPSVLLTGGLGYLGSQVAARLRAAGIAVRTFDIGQSADVRGDLLDPADVRRALRPDDLVVHCAALIQGRDVSDARLYDANMAMLANLLDAGARRVVFVSSMTVYTPPLMPPVREDAARPESAYARSKFDGERLLADRAERAVSLRLPGLFGPPRASGLIHALFAHAATGAPLTLPPAPLLWAAMRVEHAADAIAATVQRLPAERTVMNVGYPDVFSVSRLVDAVCRLFARPIPYAVEHPDFQMDLTRYESLIGPLPGALDAALADYAGLFQPALSPAAV